MVPYMKLYYGSGLTVKNAAEAINDAGGLAWIERHTDDYTLCFFNPAQVLEAAAKASSAPAEIPSSGSNRSEP